MSHPTPGGAVRRLAIGTAAALAVLTLTRCSDGSPAAPPAEPIRLLGAPVAVGGGTMQTEVRYAAPDELVSVTVRISPEALEDLPAQLPSTEFILPLPEGGPTLAFDHVGVNWAPAGHPAPGVYDVPHFDVHFYLATQAERDAIVPADPAFAAKAARAPDADLVPAGYVADAAAVPRMGTHWTDPSSHEFHGEPFTATFVYGFFNGRMVFLEPMLTRDFLLARATFARDIPQPARYDRGGDYPTRLVVRWSEDEGLHRLELVNFVRH